VVEASNIGFALQADPGDGASWVRIGRRAENAGFEAICVGDHPGLTASPFVARAALAHSTSTILLGTAVLNLGTWEPLSLAAEVATLHLLSGG
jgi:alkanesulfonate monooxygenase SsuD/methylene tetrahydromethanopterin reductase-like flavin-dependent oxidoreductase (luciferase family)